MVTMPTVKADDKKNIYIFLFSLPLLPAMRIYKLDTVVRWGKI